MSVWTSLYLAGYISFSIWAHFSDFKGGRIKRWALLEMIGNFSLVVAALCYWDPVLRFLLGKTVAVFFGSGLLSMIIFLYRGVRKNVANPDLSAHAGIMFSVFGTISLFLITFPLIAWGWQASAFAMAMPSW